MSTEDTTITRTVRDMGDEEIEVNGVVLRRGTVLYLQVGDYKYDESWLNARPIELHVHWAGRTPTTSDDYIMVEGIQPAGDRRERARFRCVLIRVEKLSDAVLLSPRTVETDEPSVTPPSLPRSDG